MQELIEEALIRKARSILRRHQAGIATSRKYASRYTKRTGKPAGRPKEELPKAWAVHPHYDPRYCIKHSKYLSRVIWQKLKTGAYEPVPAIQYEIAKPSGGTRIIMAFSIPDAAVANVVHRKATERNLNLFSADSYAYRPDKSVFDAILSLSSVINGPKVYVVQYDFSKYFDTIDQAYLVKVISNRTNFLLPAAERFAMIAFLKHKYAKLADYPNGEFVVRDAGVPQGSSLSLFLSNAAAHALDSALEQMNGSFVRFADDVVAITRSYGDALRVAEQFRRHCATAGLKINRQKSPGIRLLSGSLELEHRAMAIDGDDIAELKTIDFIDYLGHRLGAECVEMPEKSIKRIKARISSIIHKHLFLYTRGKGGAMGKGRVEGGALDWDFVTCLNELRKYIYGGLGETQIRKFLEGTQRPSGIRGLMAFMPLLSGPPKQLVELDGWLLNVLLRAQHERVKVAAKHGITLKRLKKEDILQGTWYAGVELFQDSEAPSFVRAWRAARKFYLRYGLKNIEPPAYYSMVEYQ